MFKNILNCKKSSNHILRYDVDGQVCIKFDVNLKFDVIHVALDESSGQEFFTWLWNNDAHYKEVILCFCCTLKLKDLN